MPRQSTVDGAPPGRPVDERRPYPWHRGCCAELYTPSTGGSALSVTTSPSDGRPARERELHEPPPHALRPEKSSHLGGGGGEGEGEG